MMIKEVVLVVYFCIMKTADTVVADQTRFARYVDLENKHISTFSLSTSQEISQEVCAETCKRTSGCESFFYDSVTGNCELRDALFITPNDTTDQMGMMYYFAMKGKSDWCPSWKGFKLAGEDGPCLKFHTNSATWYDANETCVTSYLNSRLLVVNSQAKKDLIVAMADANGLSGTFFIGMYEDEQDSYKWVDSSDMTFQDWHTSDNSSPDKQDCVHLLTWRWVRNECSVNRRFVCEMVPDKTQYLEMMNIT